MFILWDDLLGTDLQNAIYSHYDNPGQSIFLKPPVHTGSVQIHFTSGGCLSKLHHDEAVLP